MLEVIAAADEGGYFDIHPLLADLTPEQVPGCEAVAARLMDFDGQGSWRVSKGSVAAFVGQFPPRLRTEMLEHLQKIRFLGLRIPTMPPGDTEFVASTCSDLMPSTILR